MVKGALTVPDHHQPILAALAGLGPDSLDRVRVAIKQSPVDENAMRTAVDQAVPEVEDAFSALLSAAVFRSSRGTSAEETAQQIAGAIDELDAPGAIASLLSEENLVLLAKALDLGSAYDRTLYASRLITDVRPMFDETGDAGPLGSIIVHTLQLTSFATSGAEDVTFVLDRDDLVTLGHQVQRALAKGETLRSALKESSLAVVRPAEETA